MAGNGGMGKGDMLRRHRKQEADAKILFRKPAIRRLARRGGVKRINGGIYEDVRAHSNAFLQVVMARALVYTAHEKRRTVTSRDIKCALMGVGINLYT